MNMDKVKTAMNKRAFTATEKPAAFAAVAPARILDLDVRDDLRNGLEPFDKIMDAQMAVSAGGVLRLRATFEPVPLYTVLGRNGFEHWTEKLADDDWCVWFLKQSPKAEDVVVLDVRGLEPPEPMERTLLALDTLAAGQSLLQINNRVPQFLLPLLADRGFEYEVLDQKDDEVRGMIRRKASEKQLDVRVIPPREKHPAIFMTFEALTPGNAFVLINDHDPFPLRYQFEAELHDRFNWTYLEQGPTVWRVRIGKNN